MQNSSNGSKIPMQSIFNISLVMMARNRITHLRAIYVLNKLVLKGTLNLSVGQPFPEWGDGLWGAPQVAGGWWERWRRGQVLSHRECGTFLQCAFSAMKPFLGHSFRVWGTGILAFITNTQNQVGCWSMSNIDHFSFKFQDESHHPQLKGTNNRGI